MPSRTRKRRGYKNRGFKGGNDDSDSDSEKSVSSKNKTEKKKPKPKMSKEDEKLIESEVVYFDSKSKGDIKVLSNFYKCDIKVDNTLYPSGEHAFHGEKYKQIAEKGTNITGTKRKKELEDYGEKFTSSGEFKDLFDGKIKTKGGKKGMMLDENERKLWASLGEKVQEEISQWKFDHCDKVKETLLATGDKTLVHRKGRTNALEFAKNEKKQKDTIWEGLCVVEDGKVKVYGKNILGKVWMKIREKNK
jgi:predicted NAD-dependent protein-ADP-ribosyltransferase YbiA (DUF1768 family)